MAKILPTLAEGIQLVLAHESPGPPKQGYFFLKEVQE
jgi:hypothetical protein